MKCKAKRKDGQPCRGAAGPSGTCNFHGEAGERGRQKGGKVPSGEGQLKSLRPLANKLIEEVHRVARNQSSPDRLRAIANAVDSLLALLPAIDLLDRVTTLEKELLELRAKGEHE